MISREDRHRKRRIYALVTATLLLATLFPVSGNDCSLISGSVDLTYAEESNGVDNTEKSDRGSDSDSSNDSKKPATEDVVKSTEPDPARNTTPKEQDIDQDSDEESTDDQDTDISENTQPQTQKSPSEDSTKRESDVKGSGDEEAGVFYYVRFIVKDTNGENVLSPNITVERYGTDPSNRKEIVQPENGRYRIKAGDDFDFCWYKVEAEGYESRTGNFYPSQYSDRYVDFTVTLAKKPDQNRTRNLSFRVVDSAGKVIPEARVLLQYSDNGNSYSVHEPAYGLDYVLRERTPSGNRYRYYQYTASAPGYLSSNTVMFDFQYAYGNPFDPKTTDDPIVLTVRLKSEQEVLEDAKATAIQQIKTYKNRNDYRDEEKAEYDRIVSETVAEIRAATDQQGIDNALKSGKAALDSLKTADDYENEELRKNIYFRSNDGRVVELGEDGIITLSDAESGTFYFRKPGGGNYANNASATYWRCEVKITSGTSTSYNFVIGAYGQYQPRVVGGPYDATVKVRDLNRTVPFKVRVVKERIDQLKAYVDDRDVSGGTVHVSGSEGKRAVIKGHISGTNIWKTLPINAVEFASGGSVSVNHSDGTFKAWGAEGTMKYSLTTDPSVSVSFKVVSDPVRVTGISVYAPETWTIDLWDNMSGDNVGILEGDADEKNRYHVNIYPSNATNPAVTWTALTPDIATQSDKHSVGIVPKKAGLARFLVTSVDNPNVSTTVSIRFVYDRILRIAVPDQTEYYMTVGQTKNFNIITNGQSDSSKGATEQRFHWTYSTSGVATVSDRVSASGASKTFTHSIKAENEGVVYVTGTPYDSSGGCAPIRFKVIVTGSIDKDRSAAAAVEGMINSIGTVTMDKRGQIEAARNAFNDLTSVQRDLVDDDVYAKLVEAEQKIRRLERDARRKAEEDSQQDDSENDSEHTGAGPVNGNAGGGDSGDAGGGSGDLGQNSSGDSQAVAAKATAESADTAKAVDPGTLSSDSMLMQEITVDKVNERFRELTGEPDVLLWLALLLLLSGALIHGAGRKYREFRTQTG